VLTTLALAAALSAPVPKAPAPELKWRFAKGDTFYVVAEQEATASVNLGGNAGAQRNVSTSTLTYKVTVTDAGPKATVLEVEFIAVEVGAAGGGGAAPVKPEGVAGKTLTFTLDADHKVTKVTGVDELLKAVGPGGANGLLQGEEAMKHMLDDPLRAVPGKTLTQGDTWTAEHAQAMGQGISLTRTDKGTVAGTEGGLTKLTVEADRVMQWGANAPINLKLKGEKGKRTVLFDPKAGRVRKVTDEYALTGDGNIGGGGGQAISLTMEMKATITVSDDPPKAAK
jgi:hypothetical protein